MIFSFISKNQGEVLQFDPRKTDVILNLITLYFLFIQFVVVVSDNWMFLSGIDFRLSGLPALTLKVLLLIVVYFTRLPLVRIT